MLNAVISAFCFTCHTCKFYSYLIRNWIQSSAHYEWLNSPTLLNFWCTEYSQSLYGAVGEWVVIYIPGGGGGLPYVGYMGMCHRPGSIFHFQKSRTGPKFWGFTPEQALLFDILLQNRILFSQSGLRCLAQMSKSQLLSTFVSCSLMSSLLFYYTWASVSNFL